LNVGFQIRLLEFSPLAHQDIAQTTGLDLGNKGWPGDAEPPARLSLWNQELLRHWSRYLGCREPGRLRS
jgi:hypothetical protein